jgi:hypothetical protein
MNTQHHRRAVTIGVNAGVRLAKLAAAAGPVAIAFAPLGIHLVAFTGLAANLRPSRLRRLLPARRLARLTQ